MPEKEKAPAETGVRYFTRMSLPERHLPRQEKDRLNRQNTIDTNTRASHGAPCFVAVSSSGGMADVEGGRVGGSSRGITMRVAKAKTKALRARFPKKRMRAERVQMQQDHMRCEQDKHEYA